MVSPWPFSFHRNSRGIGYQLHNQWTYNDRIIMNYLLFILCTNLSFELEHEPRADIYSLYYFLTCVLAVEPCDEVEPLDDEFDVAVWRCPQLPFSLVPLSLRPTKEGLGMCQDGFTAISPTCNEMKLNESFISDDKVKNSSGTLHKHVKKKKSWQEKWMSNFWSDTLCYNSWKLLLAR